MISSNDMGREQEGVSKTACEYMTGREGCFRCLDDNHQSVLLAHNRAFAGFSLYGFNLAILSSLTLETTRYI